MVARAELNLTKRRGSRERLRSVNHCWFTRERATFSRISRDTEPRCCYEIFFRSSFVFFFGCNGCAIFQGTSRNFSRQRSKFTAFIQKFSSFLYSAFPLTLRSFVSRACTTENASPRQKTRRGTSLGWKGAQAENEDSQGNNGGKDLRLLQAALFVALKYTCLVCWRRFNDVCLPRRDVFPRGSEWTRQKLHSALCGSVARVSGNGNLVSTGQDTGNRTEVR